MALSAASSWLETSWVLGNSYNWISSLPGSSSLVRRSFDLITTHRISTHNGSETCLEISSLSLTYPGVCKETSGLREDDRL